MRLLIKFGVSAGLLAYILSVVPLPDITAAVVGVELRWLALGFLVVPFVTLAAAAQQKVLTDRQGMSLSIPKIAEINLIANFYGLFLPGYLAGGVFRWYRMSRPGNHGAEAAAAIVYNRTVETLVTVLLGVAFWFVARPPDTHPLISVVLLGLVGALLLFQALLFNRRVSHQLREILDSKAASAVPDLVGRNIRKVLLATSRFDGLPARSLVAIWTLCIARHLLGVVSFLWLAFSLNLELSFAAAGWVRSFLQIAMLLPLSFAGLGVREATLVVALQSYGVPAGSAVALSLLFLARDLVRAMAGGFWEARYFFFPAGRGSAASLGAHGKRIPPLVSSPGDR